MRKYIFFLSMYNVLKDNDVLRSMQSTALPTPIQMSDVWHIPDTDWHHVIDKAVTDNAS